MVDSASQLPFALDPGLALLALGVSAAFGVLFGYYSAVRLPAVHASPSDQVAVFAPTGREAKPAKPRG